ncbi:hypothetical protein BDQ17DRAFT_1490390 [Cyathus striatus]|nr:hypothetical protein BDQ17DRAFT_1490390 [Cyathus striatus]
MPIVIALIDIDISRIVAKDHSHVQEPSREREKRNYYYGRSTTPSTGSGKFAKRARTGCLGAPIKSVSGVVLIGKYPHVERMRPRIPALEQLEMERRKRPNPNSKLSLVYFSGVKYDAEGSRHPRIFPTLQPPNGSLPICTVHTISTTPRDTDNRRTSVKGKGQPREIDAVWGQRRSGEKDSEEEGRNKGTCLEAPRTSARKKRVALGRVRIARRIITAFSNRPRTRVSDRTEDHHCYLHNKTIKKPFLVSIPSGAKMEFRHSIAEEDED